MKKIIMLIGLFAVLLSGCKTHEYYKEAAVIRARKYLLKNAKELSYEESSYVKYNRPVILHHGIFAGDYDISSDVISSDLSQIAVAWKIPEVEKIYMVWGVSSGNLRDFSPDRLIVKKFVLENTAKVKTITLARQTILNNLSNQLKTKDYNYIRFTEPEILKTNFVFDKKEITKNNKEQIAFIWRLKDSQEIAVVSGEANQNLDDFVIYATGLFTNSEFTEFDLGEFEEATEDVK